MKTKNILANVVLDKCTSTNDIARKLANSGCPHGTWISAIKQTSGKGRLGRSWISQEGNLFLSIVLRSKKTEHMTWHPLVVAYGVCSALTRKIKNLNVKIKWPNDLYLNNAKLGGILCEGTTYEQEHFIIAGIGINCLNSPKDLDQKTISLTEFVNLKIITANEIRPVIIATILKSFDTFKTQGISWIKGKYSSCALLTPNTKISWDQIGTHRGTVIGLGPSGELLVENSQGQVVSLFAEDVRIL
ncbi:MAG: biotin--[acetyl-CoA-carboxylase] ligase [Bdellovibrio sp.]|nr:biotin--[acetyl-CoA-carboxylase] ligase [Bdellovibrio sp.]